MKKHWAAAAAAAFLVLSCCACTGGGTTATDFDLSEYAALPEIRFSSLWASEQAGSSGYKMKVPFTDTYTVDFKPEQVARYELFDAAGALLKDATSSFEIALEEGQRVYARVTPKGKIVRVTVTAKENESLQPFELAEAPAASSFETVSKTPSVDPLQPAEIKYIKRPDTLYVYCNAPETLADFPDAINHCITRQDVSGREVFFTFEHQSGGIDPGVWYGYRVTNTGTEDAFITVKNVGFQCAGAGSFHGEQEWTQFYNTKFGMPDMSLLSDSQKENWKAYFNFGGGYPVLNIQPTTYRVPAGKFIYVIGGTTSDAFGKCNVFNTADKMTNGNCQNGAVLFDVVGSAMGAFYIYNKPDLIAPGTPACDTEIGIVEPSIHMYGAASVGDDEGFVVDNSATWTFNDATPAAEELPVVYTNYYEEGIERDCGIPGKPIDSTPHVQERTDWVTHNNVQNHNEVVGTDMTSFRTVYGPDRLPVTIGCETYDSRGILANIGNWMKDYQDLFTFVNQGDTEREVTVSMYFKGAIVAMVRDLDGKIVEGTEKFYFMYEETEYGEAVDQHFSYSVKVPAHSVMQFVVEYNLMANSYGTVRHTAGLK